MEVLQVGAQSHIASRTLILHVPHTSAPSAEKLNFQQALGQISSPPLERLRLVVTGHVAVTELVRQIRALREDTKLVVEIIDREGVLRHPKCRRAFELVGAKFLPGDDPLGAFPIFDTDSASPDMKKGREQAGDAAALGVVHHLQDVQKGKSRSLHGADTSDKPPSIDFDSTLNVFLPCEAPVPEHIRKRIDAKLRERLESFFPATHLCLLDLGRGCNQNCQYCLQDKSKPQAFTLDSIGRRILLARKLVFEAGAITGGEPLVHPQWKTVVMLMGENFKHWGIFTNGIRLADQSILDWLLQHGLSWCSISFDSHNPQIQNRLSRNPNTFDSLERCFAILAHHPHIKVDLTAVINSLNAPSMLQHIRYIRSWRDRTGFSPSVSFSAMMPNQHMIPGLMLRYSETVEYLKPAIEACLEWNIPFLIRHIPLCLLQGLEQYSSDLYLANKMILEDGTQIPVYEQAEIPACQDCSLRSQCPGLSMEYVRIYGSDEIATSPYR